MEKLNIPALKKCMRTRIDNNVIYLLQNADIASFFEFSTYFSDAGFDIKEERKRDGYNYVSYLSGTTGVFINYFDGAKELYITVEEDTKYFSFTDTPWAHNVTPQITHVGLDLFGMSYAVRLSDGRFVIFDGGTFLSDAESLLKVLKAGSPDEKPVIAAWFVTHAHADHYLGLKFFLENFMDEVVIEKFLYNFPEIDDYEHFPFFGQLNSVNDSCVTADVTELYKLIEKTGAVTYRPHTGQVYEIGGVKFEILISVDDVINTLETENVNVSSLVVRFEIEGQTILITGDSRSSDNKIVEKYGSYIKCDIFQAPHHGYHSGTEEAEVRLYDTAAPSVCFLPTSEDMAFVRFCPFRLEVNYLMTKLDLDEFITGKPSRTLSLPYTPAKNGKEELKARLADGINSNGSRTWIFAGLNSSNPEDFNFILTNLITHWPADVSIDIFFEDPKMCIQNIKYTLLASTVKKINLFGDDVDFAPANDPASLKKLGAPENMSFSVRFRSNNPIIISSKNHTADYKAPNIL